MELPNWSLPEHLSPSGASAAIGRDGNLYVGGWWRDYGGDSYEGKLFAFNPDGTLKWAYEVEGGIASSVAIGADETIYAVGFQHDALADRGEVATLYALNPDGSLKWSVEGIGRFGSPIIGADGIIYVECRPSICAFKPDGTFMWRYAGAGTTAWGEPSAIGKDGTIYATFTGEGGYLLHAINPNGSLKWEYELRWDLGNPAIGADGTIYISGYVRDYGRLGGEGLHAIYSGSRGLADSPWPKLFRDNQNTGRYR